ncbi:MAG: hypothetical protein CMM01_04295 [Rhodopirellula sp.]|nr:hypothetical protein [Rhodopirellula sp.]
MFSATLPLVPELTTLSDTDPLRLRCARLSMGCRERLVLDIWLSLMHCNGIKAGLEHKIR